MDLNRLKKHIFKFGRVFLPQSRMRHIRWEEAVVRSIARRAKRKDPLLAHHSCHCGSIECLGVPHEVRK